MEGLGEQGLPCTTQNAFCEKSRTGERALTSDAVAICSLVLELDLQKRAQHSAKKVPTVRTCGGLPETKFSPHYTLKRNILATHCAAHHLSCWKLVWNCSLLLKASGMLLKRARRMRSDRIWRLQHHTTAQRQTGALLGISATVGCSREQVFSGTAGLLPLSWSL